MWVLAFPFSARPSQAPPGISLPLNPGYGAATGYGIWPRVAMLPLTDPLWRKLDDAHRDRDIPKSLSTLAKAWDDEAANSLFWDCLCHQETCYGATYAVIPHLLKIAEPKENLHQRLEIACFLGFVVLCARRPRDDIGPEIALQGLPETADEWDAKLDCFRNLAKGYAHPDSSYYERTELLPRYRKILAVGSVGVDDLEKINSIKTDFFSALPAVRALCERALLENLEDHDTVPYLLSGVAAADGLLDLACLLTFGSSGWFRCSSCGWRYEYLCFGDRMGIYADEDWPSKTAVQNTNRPFLDYKARAFSRCDGLVVPVRDRDVTDKRAAALFPLADRAQSKDAGVLLRHFLGSFVCCKCGAQGSMRAPTRSPD
jgi:hypothetical protein